MVWPNGSSPMAPTIFTMTDPASRAFWERESFAHATAWLAPLPPLLIWNEFADSVSPAFGTRVVKVVRSTFNDPMMVIMGGVVVLFIVVGGWNCKLMQLAFLSNGGVEASSYC